MADAIIAFPQYGVSGGQTVPIKAVDTGSGYALSTSTGTASGILVAMPVYGQSGGQVVPVATVDNGDGTYALKITT